MRTYNPRLLGSRLEEVHLSDPMSLPERAAYAVPLVVNPNQLYDRKLAYMNYLEYTEFLHRKIENLTAHNLKTLTLSNPNAIISGIKNTNCSEWYCKFTVIGSDSYISGMIWVDSTDVIQNTRSYIDINKGNTDVSVRAAIINDELKIEIGQQNYEGTTLILGDLEIGAISGTEGHNINTDNLSLTAGGLGIATTIPFRIINGIIQRAYIGSHAINATCLNFSTTHSATQFAIVKQVGGTDVIGYLSEPELNGLVNRERCCSFTVSNSDQIASKKTSDLKLDGTDVKLEDFIGDITICFSTSSDLGSHLNFQIDDFTQEKHASTRFKFINNSPRTVSILDSTNLERVRMPPASILEFYWNHGQGTTEATINAMTIALYLQSQPT